MAMLLLLHLAILQIRTYFVAIEMEQNLSICPYTGEHLCVREQDVQR